MYKVRIHYTHQRSVQYIMHMYSTTPCTLYVCTVQVIKKCPDVLSVLLGTDSTTDRSTVSTTVHSTVSTYVRTVRVKKKCPYGKARVYIGRARSTVEVHGRDGEASCSTRTTTQRFYRPMPLLSLYLVLSLSSSSFSLDRQLTSLGPSCTVYSNTTHL